MIIRSLRQTVAADRTVARFSQIVCSITAGVVMVFGIRRLAVVDLTEPQLFSSLTGTLVLTGIFIVLAFLSHSWRSPA